MKTRKTDRTGNGPGKGKASISSTVTTEVLEALEYLAHRSGLSRGGYVNAAVTAAVLAGNIFPRHTAAVTLPAETAKKVRQSVTRTTRGRSQR
jgi:hypothetical protein